MVGANTRIQMMQEHLTALETAENSSKSEQSERLLSIDNVMASLTADYESAWDLAREVGDYFGAEAAGRLSEAGDAALEQPRLFAAKLANIAARNGFDLDMSLPAHEMQGILENLVQHIKSAMDAEEDRRNKTVEAFKQLNERVEVQRDSLNRILFDAHRQMDELVRARNNAISDKEVAEVAMANADTMVSQIESAKEELDKFSQERTPMLHRTNTRLDSILDKIKLVKLALARSG